MKAEENERKGTAAPYINVTPLIDVLLVLLIIFMVASPLRPSRFRALVPQETPADMNVRPNPKTLVVTIDEEMKLKLNGLEGLGSVDDTSKLNEQLVRLFEERKQNHTYRDGMEARTDLPEDARVERTVFIKAPRSIKYGVVARVIDGIKGAGAEPIGLQIDDLN